MRGADRLKLQNGDGGGRNSVVFRRRESTLSVRSGIVNDRSSYEARTVFELDSLSAIGSIVNTRDGVHRFIYDQHVREVWLNTLEREFLKRYFERLLAVYPTADEASEYLETQAASTRQQGSSARYEPIELTASTDPYLELACYATFGLLSKGRSARMVNSRSGTPPSHVSNLLTVSKERALPMLLTWLTQSNQSENPPKAEFESALLAHEDRPSVKKSLRHFRKLISREMRFLREFVAKFVSEIAEKASVIPNDSHLRRILRTHIPETFLCDESAISPPVKRAFLDKAEQQLEPGNDVNGALVDLMDPSLNCRTFDNKTRRSRQFEAAPNSRNEPEVFSAFGHGGQSSSSRLSKNLLLTGEKPGFQWLPLDVLVHSAGDLSVKIESEINSIHPVAFPAIYTAVEHMIAGFVPLFEQVLASIATAKPPAPRLQVATSVRGPPIPPAPKRFPGVSQEAIDNALAICPTSNDTTCTSEERYEADEDSAPSEAVLREHWRTHRVNRQVPLRPRFDTPTPAHKEQPDLQAFSLHGRCIQVIPKLSTIRLTPEHPKFLGQSCRKWQIDGDSDEQLVAIGYHVLEHENISMPEILFRAFAHGPSGTQPSATLTALNCERAVEDEFLAFGEKVAGYHEGSYGRKFLQPWGSVALLPDRSFAVPAILAHRLEPFELLDLRKNGRVTFLTLYLVDPTQKIESTAALRPEEHDQRWVEANVNMLRDLPRASPLLSSSIARQSRFRFDRSEKLHFPDDIAQTIVEFAANEALEAQNAARGRRKVNLEKERARRHEIRFLHHKLTLERLRIALPDV